MPPPLTLVALAALLLGLGPVAPPAAAAETRPIVAVVGFDYSDTSGEIRDQRAEHAARVASFRTDLRNGLTAGGRFTAVELACPAATSCSLATTPPQQLLTAARQAGADFIVFGALHKMSTLVGWGRVDVLEVASGKLVFDRVLSFRGDNDEAFGRAADFAAADILRTLTPAASGEQERPARGIR